MTCFPAMPATDPRPRRLAACRRRDPMPRIERAHGQEAKQPAEHPAVPFVELGQVVDKGALRLLPSHSVTRHEHRDRQRADQLHRDRRHAGAARPVGRTHRGGVLCLLCRGQAGGDQTAGDVRVQRRAGRGVGLSASRPRRPAPRRIPRRTRGPAATARQSADLAAVHRPRDDRSGRIGLQPAGQADGGNAFWGVARDAESLAKVIAQWIADNQPRRLAEVHPGRKLRRLPRRQGRARAAPRRTASRSTAS